jgi:hypothetical protein
VPRRAQPPGSFAQQDLDACHRDCRQSAFAIGPRSATLQSLGVEHRGAAGVIGFRDLARFQDL